MSNSDFNIIVFSQSTPFNQIVALIQQCVNALPFLFVSTHKLFDLEEAIISETVQRPVRFACFADFLTDEEMAWSDTYAYEIESKDNASKMRSPGRYYQYIKSEKNKLIFKNIRRQYHLTEKYLCADDLGIAADVWLEEGFSNHIQKEQQMIEKSPAAALNPTKNRSLFLRIYRYCSQIYNSFKKIHEEIFVLQTPIDNFLYLGSVTRIRPFLDNVNIQPLQTGLITNLVNLLLIFTLKLPNQPGKTILSRLQSKIISKHATDLRISTLLSSMHEYQLGYAKLAYSLNMDLMILQDGFIPENYSSRYLAFYFGVREFWVWDRLSLGLFENQGYKAEVCSFMSVPDLPVIEQDQYTVKTIVVLTSGAGDWTTLKNRSDEDLMVVAFVEIAKKFPDIEIIYRCHPLWAHKEHQGVNSIKRVDEYFQRINLNISVSKGSLEQSNRFLKDKGLWVAKGSIESDIEKADLVFGEHSFSMITAARYGKLFSSVNLTNRRDFFYSYTKLGFLHCKSLYDIVNLIKRLKVKPKEILNQHNTAVNKYNEGYS